MGDEISRRHDIGRWSRGAHPRCHGDLGDRLPRSPQSCDNRIGLGGVHHLHLTGPDLVIAQPGLVDDVPGKDVVIREPRGDQCLREAEDGVDAGHRHRRHAHLALGLACRQTTDLHHWFGTIAAGKIDGLPRTPCHEGHRNRPQQNHDDDQAQSAGKEGPPVQSGLPVPSRSPIGPALAGVPPPVWPSGGVTWGGCRRWCSRHGSYRTNRR